ncbi:MAG: hypothetical protein HWE39_07970 [Oceanospirillaceae bacterium]|nr:hypothetical protein [Oceanospirillaceae bacterium]
MKLHFPVEALWGAVRKMGASERDFSLDSVIQAPLPPISQKEEGIEVPLIEVDTPGGLLSYQGAQVVLYIPDHGKNVDAVLGDPGKGRRVHIADCITLEEMRQKNRFQRYRAVVNVTGDFDVFGFSRMRGGHVEGTARLQVCINCMKHLNYKGYVTDARRQNEIRRNFNLKDFFAEHSTLFRYLPTSFIEKKGGYSDDWKQVSDKFRASRHFTCDSCRLDLNAHKHLLHAHHVDGNKRNNQVANLMALCADCHRKQPLHDYMFIKARDMTLLQKLRKEQGILGAAADWSDLFELVDPPYNGLLRFYQKDGMARPEIGYELAGSRGDVVAEIEIAWPDAKFAVVGDEGAQKNVAALGWKAVTLEEALRGYRDRK